MSKILRKKVKNVKTLRKCLQFDKILTLISHTCLVDLNFCVTCISITTFSHLLHTYCEESVVSIMQLSHTFGAVININILP